MSLTAAERETSLLCSDDDFKWSIYTLQQRVITKLRKAGIEPERIGDDGAHFYTNIDFNRVSFRNESSRTMSDEQRAAASERLKNARKARESQSTRS